MKYFILIWGSLTVISCVSLLHYFPLLFLVIQYIYSCLLVCTYCRILALCTTWFVNSPFSYGEPSPVPSNNNNKAQGPCFSLGLDIVQKGLSQYDIRFTLVLFSLIQSTLILFGQLWSYSIHFYPTWSICPYAVHFSLIWSSLVIFGPFYLAWSYSVHFGPIWSNSVLFSPLDPLRSNLVLFGIFYPLWFYFISFGPIRSILSILVLFSLLRFF